MVALDFGQRIILSVYTGDAGDILAERLIIETGEGGVDIRTEDTCKLEAGRTAAVDIDCDHCDECRGSEETFAEAMELSPDEVAALTKWRTRKQEKISAELLGQILDKVVAALVRPVTTCDREAQTIVLKVEQENA